MRVVYRGPERPRTSALQYVRDARPLAFNYHIEGADLLGALGEYCSYCESPLPSNAAVEHIVAKSVTQDLEVMWNNFLLACVNCNSTKGVKVATEADLPNYLWPCVPVEVGPYKNTGSAFVYALDANGKAMVTAAAGAKQALAQATLELVGLDKEQTDNPAVSDRRIENRTAAWILAGQMATAYSAYLDNDGDLTGIFAPVFEEQLQELAKATGFWSVWMTQFTIMMNNRQPAITPNDQLSVLSRLFCETFPGTYYGTDLPGLPENYIGLPVNA